MAVRKVPGVSRRMRRAKMISTLAGRPMSRLSAISASKNARARRGASKTMVRETSTCRIDSSHQYPASLVLAAEGHREPVQPPLGEHLDGARLQPVADRLQRGRVVAGRRTRWTAR